MWIMCARAPWIISIRRYPLPRLLILPRLDLPPVEYCRGTKPSQAAISRALPNAWPLPTAAISALDTIGPTPSDVKGNQLSPASIKVRLSYIRAACRYAQKHHCIGQGISFDIPMPTVKNERQVYADRRQMLSIARLCSTKESRALVRIAFYSGMRLGEIFSIGKNPYIKDGLFILVDTKNGSNRIVPIRPRLNVILKYLPFKFGKAWMGQDSNTCIFTTCGTQQRPC